MEKKMRFPRRHLGRLVKQRRLQRGLSQETIAFDLGYKSRQFISNVERGLKLVPRAKIDSLAKILEVDAKELLRHLDLDKRSSVKIDNKFSS